MARRVLEDGLRLKLAAASFNLSAKTAAKWVRRYREHGRAGLGDRSSRPFRSPRLTAPSLSEQVLALRRLRYNGLRIAIALKLSRATVSRILRRAGMNRLQSLDPPPPVVRFRVDFAVSLSEHGGGPSDYITVYEGTIIGMADDDSEQKIGTLILYMVEAGRAMNDGVSLFDVMDCLDGDSCDCFANLYDPDSEQLKPDAEKLISENRATQWDIMLIERLELVPEYRGRGLGKSIALRAIQKFGDNCGVITCVPVPLQFSGLGPTDRKPSGMTLAQWRVRGFWEGVGFVRIPRSDYYIWPQ